jgi:hypothetical protein
MRTFSHSKKNFGKNTQRFANLEMETAIVTTTTAYTPGICVRRYTNTVYGVIKTVEISTHSASTSGRNQTSFCSLSWESSWDS